MAYGAALMLLEYMGRWCHVDFEWTASTFALVHVWIWMCCYLLYGTRCKMTRSNLHARLRFNCCCNNTWPGANVDVDLDWLYGTASCGLWTNRKYVGIGACLNSNASLYKTYFAYDAPCMTWSQFIAHLPAVQRQRRCHTYGSALMLILIEYMERYRVGFGRTESKLVLVYVRIWMCLRLVYRTAWRHHNNSHTCYCNTLQCQCLITLRWCLLNIWNDIVSDTCRLWPHRQYVVIGACLNLNAHTWYTMHYDTIAIAYPPADRMRYNGGNTRLCADIAWIYKPYCLGFERTGCTLV